MYNYKLTIQYDGTRYRGWQVQGNTDQTIQGKVEGVLSRLTGQPVELHGSGRTDAGVHALGQVANVKLPRPFDPSELLRELNRYLPADIGVIAVEPAPERFHARPDARLQNLPLPHLEQRNPQRAGAQLPLPPPRAAGCGCYGAGGGGFGGHPRFPQLLWPETVQKVRCWCYRGNESF